VHAQAWPVDTVVRVPNASLDGRCGNCDRVGLSLSSLCTAGGRQPVQIPSLRGQSGALVPWGHLPGRRGHPAHAVICGLRWVLAYCGLCRRVGVWACGRVGVVGHQLAPTCVQGCVPAGPLLPCSSAHRPPHLCSGRHVPFANESNPRSAGGVVLRTGRGQAGHAQLPGFQLWTGETMHITALKTPAMCCCCNVFRR
jgi:hypothetical protein